MIVWTPETYWSSSWIEVQNAVQGFSEFNGGKDESPMSKDEFDNLRELYPD